MAQITWSKGDVFNSGVSCNGLVIKDDKAILIQPGKGRGAIDVSVEDIPSNALPTIWEKLPFQTRIAFQAVILAL